ncbi:MULTISPECIES: hypothetical protein [unclassified Cryobacterium]|uniref:hypothetical protein n=1 Tax=unclassified Cryobacterium TaxID=2649013 RepID=UPI00106D5C8C|nr:MULTISPECIES: hypothetical protein [unclassified Cryobacterium]TFB96546.1 hypothetical protein E3O39_10770 [Cryobacterium sp. MDB2-A-1]TFC12830.1 hypothetical protein E3O35_07930 [Cryobacterium sp. MDB2-A-2]
MANDKLTVEQVKEDIHFANEIATEFGYEINGDGTLIGIQYGDKGHVIATYIIDITVTEETSN